MKMETAEAGFIDRKRNVVAFVLDLNARFRALAFPSRAHQIVKKRKTSRVQATMLR